MVAGSIPAPGSGELGYVSPMGPSVVLLILAVAAFAVAGVVWWQRSHLAALPVVTPGGAAAAPDRTEVVVAGIAGGAAVDSPWSGTSGLLFSAEEVIEETEVIDRDNNGRRDRRRRTRSLGTVGVLSSIEGGTGHGDEAIPVRSGNLFELEGFPSTRTASSNPVGVSVTGGGLSISSGDRRSWVEETVVHPGDRVWVRGVVVSGHLDGGERKLAIAARSVESQLRRSLMTTVICGIAGAALLVAAIATAV